MREQDTLRRAFETKQWTEELEQDARTRASKFPKDADALLWAGAACTHASPKGQLRGRAGRRCNLEDGERYLLRCIDLSDKECIAQWLLVQNLALQYGREAESAKRMVLHLQKGVGPIDPAILLETAEIVHRALDQRGLNMCKDAVGRDVLEATRQRAPQQTLEELKITFTQPVQRTRK